MADFRRWILALAVFALVFTGLGMAQSGTASQPLNCILSTNPNNLRAEGYTELTGDLVITCTGGVINYAVGAAIPTANITVILNATVTSRLLSKGSEVLLMIDDPESSTGHGYGGSNPIIVPNFGNDAPQVVCGDLNGAGTTTSTGCGPVYYHPGNRTDTTGTAPIMTNAAGTATGPNVYQGVISGSQVVFNGIPILAPVSTDISRVFRITNIRVDATSAASSQVTETLAISGVGMTLQNNFGLTTGYIQNSLKTTVDAASLYTCPGQTNTNAVLHFTELFGSAFKTRFANSTDTNQPQKTPGTVYNSETGFYNPSFAGTTAAGAGLADFGTRLKAVFTGIPSGVTLSVDANYVNATTGQSWTLVTGETSGWASGDTVPPSVVSIATSSTAPLSITNGTATAVWEITGALSNVNETISPTVYVNYATSSSVLIPSGLTSIQVAMSYAPTGPASWAVPSSTLLYPRFKDTSTPQTAITISVCQTALLFPYVTNVAGYDTGLAIANTTVDPWGTVAQSGTCAINWYQGSNNPPQDVLGAGNAIVPATGTAPAVIPAGTITAFNVSSNHPGFNGYVIAVCNFQYAHGFAFVSDYGARNLAMGYLALVMGPNQTTNCRGSKAPNSCKEPPNVEDLNQ
jgi:hypothetical protein